MEEGAMLCKCIWPRCDKVWGEAEQAGNGNNAYSHGLCAAHARLAFTSTFRRQQRREGNPDCYLRCSGYCHQHWCTFHPFCTKENPEPADMAELQLRLAARHALPGSQAERDG